MSGIRDWFINLDTTTRRNIKLGNANKLENVFYVPNLQMNLFNVGQLQERGLIFLIKQGCCKMFHEERGNHGDLQQDVRSEGSSSVTRTGGKHALLTNSRDKGLPFATLASEIWTSKFPRFAEDGQTAIGSWSTKVAREGGSLLYLFDWKAASEQDSKIESVASLKKASIGSW
ncbi:hypothetical protein V2J09_003141 [Rumex salicifolius]